MGNWGDAVSMESFNCVMGTEVFSLHATSILQHQDHEGGNSHILTLFSYLRFIRTIIRAYCFYP